MSIYENQKRMMQILYKADSRGYAKHEWLETYHTFSFAGYHDSSRMNFGVLRVLNDDIIDGGRGFGMHPHNNMEIITIPFEGALRHQDDMGNSKVIETNDIQVMSAGTGVTHSEVNANSDKNVKLFQIWIFPNKQNVTPRYDQISIYPEGSINKLQQILSPNPDDEGVWIHQDAWMFMGDFESGIQTDYKIRKPGNGVFLMSISGDVLVGDTLLNTKDAIGIYDTDQISIQAKSQAKFLIIEVPMSL